MFTALLPPEPAVEDLEEFLAPRQEAEPGFRWTLAEHWHVTLGFMPAVADRNLDDLIERLQRAGARRTPFRVSIAGGGALPNPARARILYAGLDVDPGEELHRLATGARAAATKSGTEVDGARFHAHLTLARTGRPVEATRWIRVLDAYRGPAWTATEFALIRSYLGEGPRRRPRYETVATFPLGRGQPADPAPDSGQRGHAQPLPR